MVSTAAEPLTRAADELVRTILVVEDEEDIRSCVAEFLRDSGFHVLEAGAVAEAKAIILARPVDLVFSDINMPRSESGFALEKWLRREFPRICVLLTSGFPQPASDTRNLAEPLMPKPYRYAELLRRIEACIMTRGC